jgi:hypothetical protein
MLLIPLGTTQVCSPPVKEKETSTWAKLWFGEKAQMTPTKNKKPRRR